MDGAEERVWPNLTLSGSNLIRELNLSMKIAFVKQKYVPFGGGEGYLSGLMGACSEKGHEVHLITTGWENGGNFPFDIHEARICKRSRRSRVLSFAASVSEVTSRNSFDVVFSLERTVTQNIWRAGDCVYLKWLNQRALYESGLKTIFNRLSPGQRAVVAMEKRCVDSTPFIIANSKMIRRDLQEVYPEMDGHIEVIYNGYDPLRFSLFNRAEDSLDIRQELGLRDVDKVLLFVASGWRRKGLFELMHALQGLPEVKLLVLGRDKITKWEKISRKLRVNKQVIFIDPRKDIQRLYHAVDLTVLPSWYDSFGFVTLESLACGTPVVVSEFAGSHELILSGVNGKAVSRPDSINEMRSAIVESLKINSPIAVAESVLAYTMENNVRKTLDLIERSVV